MTPIEEAAIGLKEICTRYGEHAPARGATDAEINEIKQTFTDLEFPLPAGLLEVYRVTLAIPGVLNDEPVLGAPCIFSGPSIGFVSFLIDQEDDVDTEGVLWLGRGNEGDLIIDRDGQCALVPEFQSDRSVQLINPTDFETAFLSYVSAHEAELNREFKDT
jgi:hypothetical protein